MSDELKACPFCGSEPVATQYIVGGDVVQCTFCSVRTRSTNSRKEAIEAWNERPFEDALLARAEKAEAMVARLIEAGDWLALHYEVARTQQGFCLPSLRIKIWRALAAECRGDK